MAVKVSVPYNKTFSSARSLEETFSYLADFQKSIPENFKGLQKFEKVGENRYRWEFEKIGHSGYEIQIRFTTDAILKSPKLIELKSVAEPGGAEFSGKWELASGFDGAQIKFTANFGLELNIPFLMKGIAVPLAQKEFTKFFDRYTERVEKTLAE